jgi:hypothetical protein
MKKIIKESGIRNITQLKKRYPKAEIYFHQDLDGVTTAIAMKKYLEDNGINVVGVHIIQYGDKEFSIKKNDAKGDTMPVLVDFAHGKPMFVIHTDHHDSQVGVEKGTSTQFRGARSNVQTMSQVVSPKELFPSSDILLISTVDSADFLRQNLSPDDVINYLFRLDKEKSLERNKMLMGLVINKLLLAFKNKPGFMEEIVMNSEPSLISILNNIRSWMDSNSSPKPEVLQKNAENYIQSMKTYSNMNVEDGVIYQYGGGNMFKPGSFDRYTPFKNNPEADFLVMAWPMGIVQASCNPYKSGRNLKGVNLKDIAMESLGKWEDQLKVKMVPLSTLKWVSEETAGSDSVGFTFEDFNAIYGGKLSLLDNVGEEAANKLSKIMSKKFSDLTEDEMSILDKFGLSAWDIIISNSGGHKCITNVSGLNYLGRSKRPPQKSGYGFKREEESPHVKFIKMLGNELRRKLIEKIKQSS